MSETNNFNLKRLPDGRTTSFDLIDHMSEDPNYDPHPQYVRVSQLVTEGDTSGLISHISDPLAHEAHYVRITNLSTSYISDVIGTALSTTTVATAQSVYDFYAIYAKHNHDTSYYTKVEIDSTITSINNTLSNYVLTTTFNTTLNSYYTVTEVDTFLANKPSYAEFKTVNNVSIFGTGNIDTAIDMDDALSSYYTNVTIDQMFSNLNNIYIPLTNIYSINVLYENIDTPSLAVVSADRYNTMLNNYVYNYLLENYIEEYVLTTDDTIRVNTTYYILTDGVYVDSGLVYDDTDGADNTLPTGIDYYVIQQISQGLPASTNKLAPIFAAKVHTHTPDEVGTTGFITVDVPDLTHYYTSSVIDNKLNSLAPLSSLSNYVSCSDLEDTGIFPNVMYSDMLSDEVSIDPDTDEEIVPTVTSKNINTYTTQGNYFFTTAVTNGPSIDTTLLAYPSTDTGLLQVYTTVTQTVTDDTTTTVDNNTFYVITQVFIDDNQNTYTRSATNHYDVVIDPVIDDETLFDEDGNEIEPEVDGTDYVLEFTTWCDTYEVDYTWTQEQVSTHFSTVIEYIFTTDETFGSSKEYYVYANDSYVLVDLADEESDVTYGDEIPADTYYEIKSTDAWVEEWNSYYSNVTIYLSNIYTWSNWICSMSTNTIGSRIWISDLTDCVCTYLQDTYETATGTYQTEVSYYSREHDGNVYVYTKLDTSSLTGTDIPDGVYIWNATTQNYIDFSIPDSISAQVNTLTSVAQVILECVSTTTDYAIGDTITDPICSNRAYNDSSFLGTAQVGIVTTDGSKRVRVYLPLVWYVKRKNSYTEVYESMTCPLYTSTDIAAWNLRVKLTY